MKRYISAILFPCLLLQLLGCYSYREITLDELQKYYGANDVRIKTNQKEVIINRESAFDNRMNWKTSDSSIIINNTQVMRTNDNVRTIDTSYAINYNQIKSMEIDEFNLLETVGLTVGILVVGIIIIAAATFKMGPIFPAGTHF
jgi:hypothetical protein